MLQLPGIQAHHEVWCAGSNRALGRNVLPKWQQLIQRSVLHVPATSLAKSSVNRMETVADGRAQRQLTLRRSALKHIGHSLLRWAHCMMHCR